MHLSSHEDLIAGMSVLERNDFEECQSSEATWLPMHQARAKKAQATGLDFSGDLAFGGVEKAKNLLLNPHYDFTEIAVELGFKSLLQFNRAFQKRFGELPRAYRARLDGIVQWRTSSGFDG